MAHATLMADNFRPRTFSWAMLAARRLLRLSSRIPRAFLVVLVAVILLAPAQSLQASGGFGSVSSPGVTNTTITINWTDPDGSHYRYPSGVTPTFKICHKIAGAWEAACGGGDTVTTTDKPYTLTGLQCDKGYKIKVYALTEKKKLFGSGWQGADWHKVGTITVSTSPCITSPPALGGNLTLTANGNSITANVTLNYPSQFETIVIGYKNIWTTWKFNHIVSHFGYPAQYWQQNSPIRGWKEAPSAASFSWTFDNLKLCKQYKLVAYGFAAGYSGHGYEGTLIGTAKIHTGASCMTLYDVSTPLTAVAVALSDDHEDELAEYAASLAAYYTGGESSIIEAVSPFNPRIPQLVAFFQTEDADEGMGSPFTLLQWLIEEQWDAFEAWQETDKGLIAAGLTLPAFLEASHPDLYADLLDQGTNPADLNGDGDVDGLDLATLLAAWGPCGRCPADLNVDGMVSGLDLAILLGTWG